MYLFICRQIDFNWLQSSLDLIVAINKHDYNPKEIWEINLCGFCAMNCNMHRPWDTKKTWTAVHINNSQTQTLIHL